MSDTKPQTADGKVLFHFAMPPPFSLSLLFFSYLFFFFFLQ